MREERSHCNYCNRRTVALQLTLTHRWWWSRIWETPPGSRSGRRQTSSSPWTVTGWAPPAQVCRPCNLQTHCIFPQRWHKLSIRRFKNTNNIHLSGMIVLSRAFVRLFRLPMSSSDVILTGMSSSVLAGCRGLQISLSLLTCRIFVNFFSFPFLSSEVCIKSSCADSNFLPIMFLCSTYPMWYLYRFKNIPIIAQL